MNQSIFIPKVVAIVAFDMLHFVLNIIDRQVAISNLLVFFSEKGLTAELVPYVPEGRKLPVPSRTFCLGACDIMMSLESQKLVLTP